MARLHVATKHLKCSQCNKGSEFFILFINLNFNSHMGIETTWIVQTQIIFSKPRKKYTDF